MAKHSTRALHTGDNSSMAFGSTVARAVDQVRLHIGSLEKSRKLDEYAPGSLHALAKLCAGEQQASVVNRGEVEEWRATFFAWLERNKKKFETQDYQVYQEAAERDFERLLAVSVALPEDLWRDDSLERDFSVTFKNAEILDQVRSAAAEKHPVKRGVALQEYLLQQALGLLGESEALTPDSKRASEQSAPVPLAPIFRVTREDAEFVVYVDSFSAFASKEDIDEDQIPTAYELEAALQSRLSKAMLKAATFDCESSLFVLRTKSTDVVAKVCNVLLQLETKKV